MLHTFVNWIVTTVQGWGYPGIFLLALLESTVIPVPSELILIPAGYLAFQGKMNFALILITATLGGLTGASINYTFALWVGRPFLERWGRYFFVEPALLHKTDHFFRDYGAVSTFTGRLVPGIRHLISLPAGLARMPRMAFALYTMLGVGLWATVLTLTGYFIGDRIALVERELHWITLALALGATAFFAGWIAWKKKIERQDRLSSVQEPASPSDER